MKMPKVKLTAWYRIVSLVLSVIIVGILVLSVISYFIVNGFCWNIFLEKGFMYNIALILITILFGLFTFISSKINAAVQVTICGIEKGTTNGKGVFQVPIDVVNRHGLPVEVTINAVIEKCGKKIFEPIEDNDIYRGTPQVFLGGAGAFNSHIDFKGKISDIPDEAMLIIKASFENQYTELKNIEYTWYWRGGKWVLKIIRG